MDSAKNETNKVTENVHKMQQEFKHTSDAAKKVKLNSGLNSDINKSTEEVKKLAKSADQSGNKFKEMFRKLRSGSSKSNGSFSKLHDSAKKTFDEVHKGSGLLKKVVGAALVSNAVISSWYALKGGISNALKAGEEYDKEQQVMHATWNTLTDSSVKGNRMVKAINSMSVAFGQSAGLVNELNQQFYHVLDKQGPTDRLTKSVLTMADTLGMSAENTKRLGLNFTHMMASSKMQLGDFNMISDQLPMFGSKLLAYERKAMHNSHLTMSQLRKDMSAGKVSAKDAENVMNSLGKKYAEASENMMKTLPGMERVMSARGAALFGALEKPFMKAKNPIFGAISKWVSDKKTEKEFTKVGTAASKGLNTITQSFAKVFNPKESPHLANDVMNNIAKGVTSVSNTIAHHAKSIVEFFKSLYYTVKILKDVGAGFAKGLVSGLSAIVTPIGKLAGNSKKIHSFSDALKSITNHKKGLEDIGKLLAGIWGTSKAMKGISFAKNMVGKTTRMFIKPEIDSKTGKHELTLFSKTIRGSARAIGRSLKWTAKIGWKGSKAATRGLRTATKATSRVIGKSLRWTAKLAYKGVVKGLSAIKRAAIATGKGFKRAFKFLKANPFIAIITGAIAVGAALYKLYKHNKKFRKFVNGLISWAKKAWKGVTKWFRKLANGVRKYIHHLVKYVNKRWGWLFKDLWKLTKGAFKTILDILKTFYDLFTGKWGKLKKDVAKIGKDLWKDAKHLFKTGFDWVNKLTGGRLGKMVDFFKNAWHSIGKGWKNFWNGIDDWFSNLWKGIVKHVQNGINDVIKVLNVGIGGIDWVIHKFGGSKKAIGKIGYVHLATGTGTLSGQRRAITKPTMAMLNDGHDSPETGNREMLIHPNGMGELIKGTNVMRMLEPGAEVLNASETKFAMSLNGLSHFAKGTGLLSNLWNGAKSVGSSVVGGVEKGFGAIGNFAGGVLKATKKVFDTVKSIVKDPSKYLTGLLKKPSGKGVVLSDFANGFFDKMKSSATNWWSSLWSMVDLDGGSAGGNWRHNPGLSETNGFGASRSFGSHDGVDFSGPLGSAIRAVHGGTVTHVGRPLHGWPYSQLGDVITVASNDGWQEIYQEFGGMNNIKVGTGDVIKTGQRIATLGRLNGAGSGSHVHIGVSHGSLWDHGGSSTKGWYDVTKMHGKSDGSPKSSKKPASSGIQSLIKGQVGNGFFKFMSKLASKFGDTGSYGNPAGDGVSRWRKYVVKALKANGFSASPSQISAWMRVIARESNGNPKAINNWDSNAKAGHPSKGLVQTIDSTFNAYKFKGHGQIYNGFDDLLAGINYMKHIYGKGASAFSRVSGPEGYAKGGHINRNKLSIVGEKGWELFKPDTAGTVIPHEASEKLISGSKGKVTISAPTKVVIQGNADKSSIDELDSRLEKRNDDLVEKLRELWGLNDEGGLTV
ncbi:tape measure protein [Levilactobacillus namurensis]|uniref:Tape measure protein n=1 Tax=Levilactobacillus namurensis TaxID=380393 RepID=A0AAW8W9A6_9LACO|nr:tape measure protein [Levilactobacillus namurensis]MDT7015363.1 tape measure protein [Levilactobacillus namurensis]